MFTSNEESTTMPLMQPLMMFRLIVTLDEFSTVTPVMQLSNVMSVTTTSFIPSTWTLGSQPIGIINSSVLTAGFVIAKPLPLSSMFER